MKRILQRIWESQKDFPSLFLLAAVCAWGYMMEFTVISGTNATNGIFYNLTNIDYRLETPRSNYTLELPEAQVRHWITNWPGFYITNLAAVEWTGYELRYKSATGTTKDCELGLRSDGMVVWREKK